MCCVLANIKECGRGKVPCATPVLPLRIIFPRANICRALASSYHGAQRLARKLFRHPLSSHAEKHLSNASGVCGRSAHHLGESDFHRHLSATDLQISVYRVVTHYWSTTSSLNTFCPLPAKSTRGTLWRFFWQLLEVILTSFSLKWTDPYEVHLALRVCNTGSQSAVILPSENST